MDSVIIALYRECAYCHQSVHQKKKKRTKVAVINFMLCTFYPIKSISKKKTSMPKKDFSHPPPSPSQIPDPVVLSFTLLFNLFGGGSPLSY